DVAGKDVEFSIQVNKVAKAELPDLDDVFAETLGVSEGGIDKMRQEIRSSLERELSARLRSTMRERVMDALHEANKIEVPKALVEEEIDRAVQTITQQLSAQGIPAHDIDRNHYAEEAKKRVALGLIARDVIEKNEIKVDADAVRARIEEMATGYDDSEAFVNYYYSDQERLQQIEAVVLEEQVVNAMLETADVKEVKVDFKDFMNPQAG
ncbi:MAG: trigger factor, partial [Gammaproteobacteria bacterium]